MRHRVSGKRLGRTASHRRAMRRNLAAALIQHGAIRTTEAKAKHVRRFVEKLITTARKDTLHARRLVLARLRDRDMLTWDEKAKHYVTDEQTLVQKLFNEIAPRYAGRPGGYTRIIRVSERRIGDAADQVILQLVEETSAAAAGADKGGTRRQARAAKRRQAATAAGPAADLSADLSAGASAEAEALAEEEDEASADDDTPAEDEPPAEDADSDEGENKEG